MGSIKSSESFGGPRVSVCLLVYNDVASLTRTVHSILAQTLPGFEFIISDDCSTDGAWEEILNLAKAHPNIRPIRTPKNMMMCGNANYAVSHARGDYIALLHHGDIYHEELLERWLVVMERYSTVGFVFNEYISKVSSGLRKLDHKTLGYVFQERMDGRVFLEKELLSRWGCCVWGTTMIRRSCWEAVGGMREEFGMLADVDLWMRLAARWDVGYVDAPLITLQDYWERPECYPLDYRSFSWNRKKLCYSIHFSNIDLLYAKSGLRSWWKRLWFRIRLSMETCKWLTYGFLRKRPDIIRKSTEGECEWEFMPVRWYRNCLIWGSRIGLI